MCLLTTTVYTPVSIGLSLKCIYVWVFYIHLHHMRTWRLHKCVCIQWRHRRSSAHSPNSTHMLISGHMHIYISKHIRTYKCAYSSFPIHIYTCSIRKDMHIHTYTLHTPTLVNKHLYIHAACKHGFLYTLICIHACIYTCTCVHTYAYASFTCMHNYTYTYT